MAFLKKGTNNQKKCSKCGKISPKLSLQMNKEQDIKFLCPSCLKNMKNKE